jgi:hypothetical protein
MDDTSTTPYLPSRNVILFAGIILVGFVGWALFQNQNTLFSDTANSTNKPNNQNTESSSFLANQERPENSFSTTNATGTSTFTDRAAGSVAPRALALAAAQKNGENISDSDIKRIANSMSEDLSLQKPKQYSREDFTTTGSNQEEIQSYVTELTAIMADQINTGSNRGPLNVLSSHLQNQESSNIDQIDKYVENNKELIESLVGLRIPRSYADLHQQLINNLSAANTNLKRMKQIDTDPLMAAVGIQKYRSISNQSLTISDKIADKINQDL